MLVLGGFLGFVLSLAFGLSRDGSWLGILGRACLCALLGGLLFRWWSHIWLRGLQECYRQRREEARIEADRKAAEKKQQEQQAQGTPVTIPTHQP